MADAIDLTCNEVIVESYIEPPSLERNHEESSQKPSCHNYSLRRKNSTEQQQEFNEVEGTGVKKGIKRGRPSKDTYTGRSKRQRSGSTTKASTSSNKELCNGNAVRMRCVDPFHTMLPIELRWTILNRLSTSDLLSLRLVSHEWKKTVDSLKKLPVKIDGDCKDFKGKCELSMKTCTLQSFHNPSHRKLFKSAESPQDVRLTRGICYLNFEELILQWSYITRLELCWRSIMKNLLFGRATMGCSRALRKDTLLPNLACLRIEILIHDDLARRPKLRILSNLINLMGHQYPSLGHVTVAFVGYRELHAEYRYLDIVLPFLNRHADSLHTIDFSLYYASHIIYPPAHPRHILFCVPANFKSYYKSYYLAQDSHLITTELRKSGTNPQDDEAWKKMLCNTRKLETVIMTRFLSWSIKHLDYFSPTIMEYAKFLRVLELMNVTMYDSGAHNTVSQLNAKVFSHCQQLAELRIFRAPIIFHENEVEPPAELINLHELPKTLQELTIDGIPVATVDILRTIRSLENLKMFHYFQSQVPRRNMLWSNGINWDVLQAILRHKSLRFVKVHVSSQANSHTLYLDELRQLSQENGWNNSGIIPGYMNMYQLTLSK